MNKNFLLCLIFCLPLTLAHAQFTSTQDGSWTDGATWGNASPGAPGVDYPHTGDNATVNHVVTWQASSVHRCNDLTVNGTLAGPNNSTFQLKITGNYVNNGTETGRGIFSFQGSGTTISGAGTFANGALWNFLTSRTIANTVTKQANSWTRIYNGSDVTNQGTLTFAGPVIAYNAGTVLTNEGTMTIQKSDFMATGDFEASTVGNTVNLNWATGSASGNIPNALSSYYDLNIQSSLFSNEAQQALDVDNDLTLTNGVTFDMNNFALNVGGDYLDNGATLSNFASITFDGTGTQTVTQNTTGTANFGCPMTIGGSSSTELNDNVSITDLTITGSLDVTAASNSDITLTGNWTNNGTFTPREGIVYFNGSVAQTLDGAGATTLSFVEQNNAAGVSLNTGTYNLGGRWLVNAGTFAAGTGMLTLTSDGTSTYSGSIGALCGTCAVTGTVTMQRFLPAGAADFRDISSPFTTGTVTLAEWDDDMIISCPTCPDGCAYGNGCYVSIKTYDPATSTYVDITGMGQNVTSMVGFETFLGDDLVTYSGATMEVDGTVNAAASLATTAEIGWNLMGNPYASAIDFDGVVLGSNVGDFYYIYDQSISGFAYYDPSGPTSTGLIDAQGRVAAMQGFWINASGGGAFSRSVTFLQSSKRAPNITFVRSGESRPQYVEASRLPITVVNKDNDATCHLSLNLCNEAHNGIDTLDIPNFKGPENHPMIRKQPLLWFDEGPEGIRSNYVAYTNDVERRFPMKFNSALSGRFEIEAKDMDIFHEYSCILLHDKELGRLVDLRKGKYTFEHYASPEDVDRFELILSNEAFCDVLANYDVNNNPLGEATTFEFSAWGNDNQLKVELMDVVQEDLTNITVYDLLGKVVYAGQFSGNIHWVPETLGTGAYIVELVNGVQVSKEKVVMP